jgi:hypothetical protein
MPEELTVVVGFFAESVGANYLHQSASHLQMPAPILARKF